MKRPVYEVSVKYSLVDLNQRFDEANIRETSFYYHARNAQDAKRKFRRDLNKKGPKGNDSTNLHMVRQEKDKIIGYGANLIKILN